MYYRRNLLVALIATALLVSAIYVESYRISIASLNRSIRCGDISSIRKHDKSIKQFRNILGSNPLEVALEAKNKEAFSLLLQLGADPHSRDQSGLPIIHRVCAVADSFWLEQLLKHAGDPNLMWPGNRVERPRRPMYVAMQSRQFHLVPILIDAGASLTDSIMIDNNADYSPLGNASDCGPEAVGTVLYLLDKGATPDLSKKSSSITAFVQDGEDTPWRKPITKWFQEHGMDLHKKFWDGSKWIVPPYVVSE